MFLVFGCHDYRNGYFYRVRIWLSYANSYFYLTGPLCGQDDLFRKDHGWFEKLPDILQFKLL
jgi:hypothetical protein